jgi:hypothetical protein
MRGVILEGEARSMTNITDGGATPHDVGVLLFVELLDETLFVRRTYGERAVVLALDLDDVEATLAALKAEQARKPAAPIVEPDAETGTGR